MICFLYLASVEPKVYLLNFVFLVAGLVKMAEKGANTLLVFIGVEVHQAD